MSSSRAAAPPLGNREESPNDGEEEKEGPRRGALIRFLTSPKRPARRPPARHRRRCGEQVAVAVRRHLDRGVTETRLHHLERQLQAAVDTPNASHCSQRKSGKFLNRRLHTASQPEARGARSCTPATPPTTDAAAMAVSVRATIRHRGDGDHHAGKGGIIERERHASLFRDLQRIAFHPASEGEERASLRCDNAKKASHERRCGENELVFCA